MQMLTDLCALKQPETRHVNSRNPSFGEGEIGLRRRCAGRAIVSLYSRAEVDFLFTFGGHGDGHYRQAIRRRLDEGLNVVHQATDSA